MINSGSFGQWEVLGPPGVTDTGRIRKMQDRTIERLQSVAQQYANRTYANLVRGVAQTYTEGEGTLAGSLQYRVVRQTNGVSVEFSGGGRHVVFLTALAGQPSASPGHFIPAHGVSRFYWKNPLHGLPPGMYRFTQQRPAFWKTRQGRDVISEVLTAGAREFAQAMIAEHDKVLVNFAQNDLQVNSRSPRVNVAAGSAG